eukprot:7034039-Pyramimonas_sp.AAC.1
MHRQQVSGSPTPISTFLGFDMAFVSLEHSAHALNELADTPAQMRHGTCETAQLTFTGGQYY